jgi:hypothetical protein
MKIQDLQKSLKFYRINIKFNTRYPISTNDEKLPQTTTNLYKSKSRSLKVIQIVKNRYQVQQMISNI